MFKQLFFFLIILIFSLNVFAVNDIEISQNPNAPTQITTIEQTELRTQLVSINQKINDLPTQEELEENFATMDNRINEFISFMTFHVIAFVIGVLILNDLLILAVFVLLKSKGLI